MHPHSDRFDKMYCVSASWPGNVLAFEQLLQGLTLDHFESKCAFSARWRPRPLARTGMAMLCICLGIGPNDKHLF